jgi:hypothetical protein
MHHLVLIHAACKRLDINKEPLTKGGIIGKAHLYDVIAMELRENSKVHFASTSFYDNGSRYGFLIRNAKMFNNHIPYRGKLRFFEVNL